MIRKENRHDGHAYTVSAPISDELIAGGASEGSWVTYNAEGKLVQGTAGKKSFMLMTSIRPGRNNMTHNQANMGTYYYGPTVVTVVNETENSCFDAAESFAEMTPCIVDAGILKPYSDVTHKPNDIVAYSLGPVINGDTLRLILV